MALCCIIIVQCNFWGVSFHNQTFNQILGQVVPWRKALKLIVPKFDISLASTADAMIPSSNTTSERTIVPRTVIFSSDRSSYTLK